MQCMAERGAVGSIGISLSAGSSSRNILETVIANNIVTSTSFPLIFMDDGIRVDSGTGIDNIIMVEIRGNEVRSNGSHGILISSGSSTRPTIEAVVTDNIVTHSAESSIAMQGSRSGSSSGGDSMALVEISRNEVRSNGFNGNSGLSVSTGELPRNIFEVVVNDNIITHSVLGGLSVNAGFRDEAFENVVMAEIRGNEVRDNSSGIGIGGGAASSKNIVDAIVADNLVTNSEFSGINIFGGEAKNIDSVSLNNIVTGTILNNIAHGNGANGIRVSGGTGRGEVFGNAVREAIISNTADGFLCEDGIAGNTAKCTCSDNVDTTGALLDEECNIAKGQPTSAAQTPVSQALTKRLSAHRERVVLREQQIRERAETITDERLRKRLHRLCDRLEALQDKLAARMAGKSLYLHDR